MGQIYVRLGNVVQIIKNNFSFDFRLQWDLCWAHLPRLFSVAMNCFLSPHSQVVDAAAQTLMVLHCCYF